MAATRSRSRSLSSQNNKSARRPSALSERVSRQSGQCTCQDIRPSTRSNTPRMRQHQVAGPESGTTRKQSRRFETDLPEMIVNKYSNVRRQSQTGSSRTRTCNRSQNATVTSASQMSTRTRRQVSGREPQASTSAGDRRRETVAQSGKFSSCRSELKRPKKRLKKQPRKRRGRLAPPQYRAKSPARPTTRAQADRNLKELLNRIRSLPMIDRPIPQTTDPDVLGFELKVRLGARAPRLVETGRRGGPVTVTEVKEKTRLIPVLDINQQQDHAVNYYIRVKSVEENRRRARGA